jgi:hypothetical protein
MRRIDAIAISLGVFVAGGVVYVLLQVAGLDGINAGVWSQALLVGGLVGWILTYLLRVFTSNMTYNQQRRAYEDAYFAKRLEEMTPEELEKLQAEIEEDKQKKSAN